MTDFCPVTPLDVAIIVADPASRPVISPEASMCAIVGSELDQVTFRAVGKDGKVDNRLTNIGTKHHRNYVIELKG